MPACVLRAPMSRGGLGTPGVLCVEYNCEPCQEVGFVVTMVVSIVGEGRYVIGHILRLSALYPLCPTYILRVNQG